MKYLRIKKNTDFQKLFSKGKKVFSPYITLLYFPCDKLKMGVAVSKKHGKAVKRNRIKRLLRAAFNDSCGILQNNYSVVLIPKISTDGIYTYAQFKDSLSVCFNKINSCKKA